MPHRYFTRELADGRAALTGSDAHHLADVMRARLGEEVVLCGPDGLEYLGTVTAIEPGRVEFSVTDGTTSKAEPDCTVTLFAGYPKQGKLEEVIRHSVELGVTGIVPFFSRYCVAAPKKRMPRTSGTTALPPRPPSRRVAPCCPMWPCRCPILPPSAPP